MIDLMRRR
jgi:hypothetical protein